MIANKTILQMKYARIVRLFAERVHLSYEDALGFFYDSETYGLIDDGVADMHCLSDEYLAEELVLEYNGIVETGYIDTFFLHACRINLRQFGVIQHYGANGALGRLDVETGGSHLVAEVIYVLYQLVVQGVALFQHLEHFEARADDARSQGVGEQVRAAALTQ